MEPRPITPDYEEKPLPVRPIKDLLQILLDNLDELDYSKRGFCTLSMWLEKIGKINIDEYWELREYLAKNQPSYNRYRNNNRYWWKPGSVPPTERWLKKHIKLN